jgi:DNA polymerase III alpha subunit
MMAAFAGYGFPKAHAASYAKVSWRSAWCKCYFPAEFMAAVLANWGGYYSQRVYLSEARRLGLRVRPPHVNHSRHNFTVDTVSGKKMLFMGLDQVKGLTRRTIEKIIRFRTYHSLDDFLSRADPRPQEAECLAKVGALENLGTIPAILKRLKGGWMAGQMSLFSFNALEEEDWDLEQKMAAQQELLGTSLEAHPLELLAEQVEKSGAITTAEAAERMGKHITVAGIRQTSRRSRTARGEMMMSLVLEDPSGILDVIILPEVYRRTKAILSSNSPMLITGTVEVDGDRNEPFLRAEQITLLS